MRARCCLPVCFRNLVTRHLSLELYAMGPDAESLVEVVCRANCLQINHWWKSQIFETTTVLANHHRDEDWWSPFLLDTLLADYRLPIIPVDNIFISPDPVL